MSEERVIRIVGDGKLSLIPDVTVLSLKLSGLSDEYGKAVEMSASDTDVIKDLFVELGLDRETIKTTEFGISEEYDYLWDPISEKHEQVFKGYKYIHRLKVEFDKDRDFLSKVLTRISKTEMAPHVSIAYAVKDKEAAKRDLLANAVNDANKKAEILVSAAGGKMGQLKSIEFNWGSLDFETREYFDNDILCLYDSAGDIDDIEMEEEKSIDFDIEPEDIELFESVKIEWEIVS